MATPTLVQEAKNHGVYSTTPVTVVLPVAATAGNSLTIVVTGAKLLDPNGVAGLAAATAAPVLKDNLGNVFTPATSKVNFDGDLGYWVSLYLYNATGIAGGNRTFTLTDLDANGRPTFDGGLCIEVFEYTGVTTIDTAAVSKYNVATVASANPAVAGTITTTVAGDLIFVAGLMRKSGEFTAPAGFTMLSTGKLVGTPNDYYGIMAGIQSAAGAITPGFVNPSQYEMAVAALALKHSA